MQVALSFNLQILGGFKICGWRDAVWFLLICGFSEIGKVVQKSPRSLGNTKEVEVRISVGLPCIVRAHCTTHTASAHTVNI